MARIYNNDGWVNWDYIVKQKCAFTMVVGARGVGKTYGLMKYLIENGIPFIYLRRLRTQLDLCASNEGNPFNKLNADLDMAIRPQNTRAGVVFADGEKTIALGVALSTVANVRGFDYSRFNVIVFDEAIASDGERTIPKEFNVFLNFYETVNRNRELNGEQPVQAFLLGNANRLTNPYFSGWHFMKTALNMIKGRQLVWFSADHSRMMIMLLDSSISKRKAETALYKNADKDFMLMALDNAFRTDGTNIRSMPIREFNYLVSVGDIGIYKHKSERIYYVSSSTRQENTYDAYGMGLKMFQQDFYNLRLFYLIQKIVYFENYECELIFRELFGLT